MTLRINRPVPGTVLEDWAERAALCEPHGGGGEKAFPSLFSHAHNTANMVRGDTGGGNQHPLIVVCPFRGKNCLIEMFLNTFSQCYDSKRRIRDCLFFAAFSQFWE